MNPHAEAPFTVGDLLELADRAETHMTVVEKLAFYETQVEDPELLQLLVRCRALFSRQVQELESIMRAIQEQSDWNTYTQYPLDDGSHGLSESSPSRERGEVTGA